MNSSVGKSVLVFVFGILLIGLLGMSGFCQSGSDLTVALSAPVTSLDPHNYRSGIDWIADGQLFDTLIYRDTQMALQPSLALSWDNVSPTVWRFRLREGVTFHDGTAFTAEAVKINFERLIDPEKPARAGFYLSSLESIEVVDDYTVELTTKVPTPAFLNYLAQVSVSIISPAALEQYGDDVALHPVGTGPFKFVEWIPGTQLVLAKNEDYFLGSAKLDRVTFKPIPEDASRVMALLSGDVDVIQFPPIEYMDLLSTDPRYTVLSEEGMRVVGIWFNVERPPLTDVLVRKALNYAVNKRLIVEELLGGVATQATGVLPPGVWGMLSYDPYPYDPAKARDLLAQAGWTDTDGDGIVDKDGKPFRVALTSPIGKYYKDTEIATVVQAQLREIGVDVRVEIWEWAAYLSHLKAHQQDFQIQGWGASPDADEPLRSTFYSGNPWNVMGYSNKEVDALLDKGLQTMNPDERITYYQDAQRIIIDDAVWIVLYNEPKLYVTQDYVKNLLIHPEDRLILTNTTVEK